MENFLKKFLAVSLVLFLVIGTVFFMGKSVVPVFASEIRTNNTIVENDEVIEGNLYIFGDNVEVAGVVKGDLIASGEKVTVTGQIMGDAYLAGQEVEIDANVFRSLFVAGAEISVDGNYNRSVLLAGGTIDLSEDTDIGEDLVLAGGQINIEGDIGEDLRVAGGEIDIDAFIGGNLRVAGSDFSYNEDKVVGEISKVDTDDTSRKQTRPMRRRGKSLFAINGVALVFKVLWLTGMYFVGVFIIRLFPVKTTSIVEKITENSGEFLLSTVVGFSAVVVVPVLVFFCALTFIGLPIAIFVAGLMVFLTIFGKLWFDMAMGNMLLDHLDKKDKKFFKSLLIGQVFRLIINIIPFVRGLYNMLGVWVSIGAFIRMKWDLIKVKK